MPRNQSESQAQEFNAAIGQLLDIEDRWLKLLSHVRDSIDVELLHRARDADPDSFDKVFLRNEELWRALKKRERRIRASKSK